jgi:Protein of unknown function (DUF4238)
MAGHPRRHHYVTKAYLDGFLEPGEKLLFCYGRKKAKAFRAAPEKLAHIRDYHSFRKEDGTLDFTLEERIEQRIESPGIPIIRMLLEGRTSLDTAQRLRLARLIALQNVRVPYERDFMDQQNKGILEGYLADMDEESLRRGVPVNAIEVAVNTTGREPKPHEWRLVRRETVNSELGAIEADPRRFSRESFFELAENLANIISKMKWTVIYGTCGIPFITSDCPVVTRDKNERRYFPGLLDLDTEVHFPLSRNAVIRIEHDKSCQLLPRRKQFRRQKRVMRTQTREIMTVQANTQMAQYLNDLVVARSYLWTVSGTDQSWLLERMQEPSKVPKRTRAIVESEGKTSNSVGSDLRMKKEFVMFSDT